MINTIAQWKNKWRDLSWSSLKLSRRIQPSLDKSSFHCPVFFSALYSSAFQLVIGPNYTWNTDLLYILRKFPNISENFKLSS